MRIKALIVGLSLFFGGCSSTSSINITRDVAPPKNIDNICSILYEKPHWNHELNKVKKKYGVPPHIILAFMHQESRFKHDARPLAKDLKGIFNTPFASSAYGYSQALEMTWAHYQKSTGFYKAKRDVFSDAVDFMGWYIDQANKTLKLSKWDAEVQYLAYHEGFSGYKKKNYRKKQWLRNTARKVDERADMYWNQYQKCGTHLKHEESWFVRTFM